MKRSQIVTVKVTWEDYDQCDPEDQEQCCGIGKCQDAVPPFANQNVLNWNPATEGAQVEVLQHSPVIDHPEGAE